MSIQMNQAVYNIKKSTFVIDREDGAVSVKVTNRNGAFCDWSMAIDVDGSIIDPRTGILTAAVCAACLIYGHYQTKKVVRYGQEIGPMPKCDASDIADIESAIKNFIK